MRTLLTLLVVGILVSIAGAAVAETLRQDNDNMVDYEPWSTHLTGSGHATLTLSPMFLEIHAVNEQTVAVEKDLLVRLAATLDEAEVQRLVNHLSRLETDRQLSVLKIRVKYARMGGQYDEAFRLRQEILQLLQEEDSPLM